MTGTNNSTGVVGWGLALALVAGLAPQAALAAEGPTVRVTRPGVGRVVLDVADGRVAVRKEIAAERSVVTLTTATDRLSITMRRGGLTVSGPGGTASLEVGTGETSRVMALLQGSEAAARARTLLAAVTDGPETFVGQSMLLTRTVLEVGSGSEDALLRHQAWVAQRATAMAARPSGAPGRPTLIRAAWVESAQYGPGDCWDLYSKEAVRIASDFGDCTDDLKWYEAHKWAGCSLVYAVRSEAAMAWFISCNGGVPFHG